MCSFASNLHSISSCCLQSVRRIRRIRKDPEGHPKHALRGMRPRVLILYVSTKLPVTRILYHGQLWFIWASVDCAQLKRKVARQFDLKTVRRMFESCACALIVDYKEITIRSIDIAQTNVNRGKSGGGIKLHER